MPEAPACSVQIRTERRVVHLSCSVCGEHLAVPVEEGAIQESVPTFLLAHEGCTRVDITLP